MEKIDISRIFLDHFRTLRHYSKDRISLVDISLFYVIPFLIALVVAFYLPSGFLSKISTELITFYSVFGGFMINLLVLVYGFDLNKFKNPDIAGGVLKGIAANISYLVTLASLAIVVLFSIKVLNFIHHPTSFIVKNLDIVFIGKYIVITFILTSFLNFALTILMVLRRFYALDQNKKVF